MTKNDVTKQMHQHH